MHCVCNFTKIVAIILYALIGRKIKYFNLILKLAFHRVEKLNFILK